MQAHEDLVKQAAALQSADLDAILELLQAEPGTELPDVDEDIRKTVTEMALLRNARRMLMERLEVESIERAERKRDQARPVWRATVRRLAAALVAVGQASATERAARAELVGAAEVFVLQPWFDLSNAHSPLRDWLRHLVDRGYLTVEEERAMRRTPEGGGK